MARRLRFIGTNSGNDGCPTLYEDLDTGEVLVQGDAVTDPQDVAQLRNVKDGEGFVHFDDDDVMTGVELVTNPVEVARACQVRDAAWHHAVPYETFAEQVPSAE
ncbi:hypothetical protein OG373_21940 [Streptomyces avidinii]|uniref:DUF6879 family protein n=1 Tax=Streptomyces avidinii TaxID=1895 RepID=UPI00386DC587|nr:hypothetical protein OG373_21940 [Streptomyces avidinii]